MARTAQVGLGVPPAEQPPPPCAPKRGVLCGKPDATTSTAAGALVNATKSARARRALRLASAKRLFGRRARAALRRSDTALRGGLAGAPKIARAAAGPKGSGTSSVSRAEVNGQLREVAIAESNVKNGRVFQKRKFRLESYVETCPNPSPGESHGKSYVRGVAVYEIVTRVTSGRRLITTGVRMRLDISQAALTTRYAELWAITNFGNADKLTITSSQSVRDRRGVRESPSSSVTMGLDALSPGTEVKFDSEGLDAFVERSNARENGDPNPFEDEAIAGKAYKTLARAFADMVGARVEALAKAAETGWKTPGKCVSLKLNGRPALLPPLGISRITGTVTPVRQGVTEAALIRDAWFDGNYINGPGVAVAVATLPIDPGEPWYDFTAPDSHWPERLSPGLDVNFYSKGGLARATITFPEGPDRIIGTYSGDVDLSTSPGPAPWQLSWTGDVTAERSQFSVPGTTVYTLTGGLVRVNFHGTGPCELNGSGTFNLVEANGGSQMPVVTVTNGETPTYTAGLAAAGAQVTVTKSNCESPEQNGQQFNYPLLGIALIFSNSALPVPSPPVYSGTGTGRPEPAQPVYNWNWDLRPG